MDFTIIIPFYNGHQYIDKLLSTIPQSVPTLIIDDHSKTPLPNAIRPLKKGYFTGAVNEGIKGCKNDVLILNQDTYFTDDSWLNFIEENRKNYGLFGESAGNHPAWPMRYVHGTFMYIRRDVINTIGLMDAKNYPLWGSTCEYQLRACRNGFKANPVRKVPGFYHERKGNFGSAIQQELKTTKQRGLLLRTPPAISVVITCYNYGRYLQDAVNSLIGGKTSLGDTKGQTRQDFEIVIVDDGSTDNSVELAEKLIDPWQGIHLIRQENKGSAAAMNTGIEKSHARSGTMIAPLDADDMMESKRLETMMELQDGTNVIYDNIRYFSNGKRGVVTNWETGKTIERLNLGTYDFEKVLFKNSMHKGLLYPKKAWEQSGGYPEIMNMGREDWAFNVALGIKGWCGVNTGEYHYLYRRELQNRTLTNTTPKHHTFFLGQIKSLFPDVYEGKRPMGCCGRPSARVSGGPAMVIANSKNLPGQDGMAIIEYVGSNSGDTTWYGPVTRTAYTFGGSKPKGYVDKRDLQGMLSLSKRGQKVFREIQPLDEPLKTGQIKLNGLPNPSELSVNELKYQIQDLNTEQLNILLNQEKSGKNRISAISVIEGQMNV